MGVMCDRMYVVSWLLHITHRVCARGGGSEGRGRERVF